MNAFKPFMSPDSAEPNEWAAAAEAHLANFEQADTRSVRAVLEDVRSAVSSGLVKFQSGDVPAAVDFANRLLRAAQKAVPGFDAWHMNPVVPPSVANFVQPAEEGTHYAFSPMFTL